jgi:hypothetical protein
LIARYGVERVRKGLTHFILGKAVSAGGGLLAMVLVVRMLSIPDFANYSVLIALVEVATALSGLGIVHVMLRYVPELYVKHYRQALQKLVWGAFLLRTGVLLVVIWVVWALSGTLAPLIGLAGQVDAFSAFLLIVIFRTTSHFLSQVLESTLHQGIAQAGFSATSLLRVVGMFYLLSSGHASLLDVIWVEIAAEVLGVSIMLLGMARILNPALTQPVPSDDGTWLRLNLPQMARFALSGYAQHMVGLPFGSNTNRLVGGYLFAPALMASFGFAQAIYEYVKRYLPAQLLIGLIRPIVVARYSTHRNFSFVAATCDRVMRVNVLLIAALLCVLAIGGRQIFEWLTVGKYGLDAVLMVALLMVVLALETQRLLLEVLAQTVERYAILIPTNLMLSVSILPPVLMFPILTRMDQAFLGALAFPVFNAIALVFSNQSVARQLAREGFDYTHAWGESLKVGLLALGVSAAGIVLKILGAHWMLALAAGIALFALGSWRLQKEDAKAFTADLMGNATTLVASQADAVRGEVSPGHAAACRAAPSLQVKILSMQRVVNYGSFMQAYALKQVVESFGHKVAFSDFRAGQPRHLGEKVRLDTFGEKLARLIGRIVSPTEVLRKRSFRRRLNDVFARRAWPVLGLGASRDFNYACDLMIVGSDEVFNYTQNHAFGYVPAMFGHDVDAGAIVSYAASAGYASLDDAERDGIAAELAAGLARFARLGVRDENTFTLVRGLTGRVPTYTIDPTLLYDFTAHIPPRSQSEDYLLVYAYEGRLDAPEDVTRVQAFARSKGLCIVSVGFYHTWCDKNLVVDPFELLSLFRHAACVVTDTFHGTIFSIKNRKPFVSLLRRENRWGSNSNKLAFLLQQLGLSGRINRDLAQLAHDLNSPIDYEAVETRLVALRADSLRFLAEALDLSAARKEGTACRP